MLQVIGYFRRCDQRQPARGFCTQACGSEERVARGCSLAMPKLRSLLFCRHLWCACRIATTCRDRQAQDNQSAYAAKQIAEGKSDEECHDLCSHALVSLAWQVAASEQGHAASIPNLRAHAMPKSWRKRIGIGAGTKRRICQGVILSPLE